MKQESLATEISDNLRRFTLRLSQQALHNFCILGYTAARGTKRVWRKRK